jgi:uncharacterized protein
MPFNLFRKNKEPEEEKPTITPQEESVKSNPEESQPEPVIAPQEATPEKTESTPEPTPEPEASAPEQQQPTDKLTDEKNQEIEQPPNKTYLKAMPLKELADLENIKNEVTNGNIIILKVVPLATKSIEDVKNAVNELFLFTESIGGDIARLGEERIVICPKTVRIWREKTPKPTSNEKLPTAA